MKVLFLDDDEKRYKFFRRARINDVIVWVKTADECICSLRDHSKEYDQIFLDHDLGGEIYVDTAHKNTGSEVVRFISVQRDKLTFKEKVEIVVHSCNTVAGKEMVGNLTSLGISDTVVYIPFTQLKNLLRDDARANYPHKP